MKMAPQENEMLDLTPYIEDHVATGYRCEDCWDVIDGKEPGYSRVCNCCADVHFEEDADESETRDE